MPGIRRGPQAALSSGVLTCTIRVWRYLSVLFLPILLLGLILPFPVLAKGGGVDPYQSVKEPEPTSAIVPPDPYGRAKPSKGFARTHELDGSAETSTSTKVPSTSEQQPRVLYLDLSGVEELDTCEKDAPLALAEFDGDRSYFLSLDGCSPLSLESAALLSSFSYAQGDAVLVRLDGAWNQSGMEIFAQAFDEELALMMGEEKLATLKELLLVFGLGVGLGFVASTGGIGALIVGGLAVVGLGVLMVHYTSFLIRQDWVGLGQQMAHDLLLLPTMLMGGVAGRGAYRALMRIPKMRSLLTTLRVYQHQKLHPKFGKEVEAILDQAKEGAKKTQAEKEAMIRSLWESVRRGDGDEFGPGGPKRTPRGNQPKSSRGNTAVLPRTEPPKTELVRKSGTAKWQPNPKELSGSTTQALRNPTDPVPGVGSQGTVPQASGRLEVLPRLGQEMPGLATTVRDMPAALAEPNGSQVLGTFVEVGDPVPKSKPLQVGFAGKSSEGFAEWFRELEDADVTTARASKALHGKKGSAATSSGSTRGANGMMQGPADGSDGRSGFSAWTHSQDESEEDLRKGVAFENITLGFEVDVHRVFKEVQDNPTRLPEDPRLKDFIEKKGLRSSEKICFAILEETGGLFFVYEKPQFQDSRSQRRTYVIMEEHSEKIVTQSQEEVIKFLKSHEGKVFPGRMYLAPNGAPHIYFEAYPYVFRPDPDGPLRFLTLPSIYVSSGKYYHVVIPSDMVLSAINYPLDPDQAVVFKNLRYFGPNDYTNAAKIEEVMNGIVNQILGDEVLPAVLYRNETYLLEAYNKGEPLLGVVQSNRLEEINSGAFVRFQEMLYHLLDRGVDLGDALSANAWFRDGEIYPSDTNQVQLRKPEEGATPEEIGNDPRFEAFRRIQFLLRDESHPVKEYFLPASDFDFIDLEILRGEIGKLLVELSDFDIKGDFFTSNRRPMGYAEHPFEMTEAEYVEFFEDCLLEIKRLSGLHRVDASLARRVFFLLEQGQGISWNEEDKIDILEAIAQPRHRYIQRYVEKILLVAERILAEEETTLAQIYNDLEVEFPAENVSDYRIQARAQEYLEKIQEDADQLLKSGRELLDSEGPHVKDVKGLQDLLKPLKSGLSSREREWKKFKHLAAVQEIEDLLCKIMEIDIMARLHLARHDESSPAANRKRVLHRVLSSIKEYMSSSDQKEDLIAEVNELQDDLNGQ